MHEIKTFTFVPGLVLRATTREDGNPWFVAKDVCDVLGLKNTRTSVALLPQKDRITVHILDGNRGNPNKALISEAGLYTLVMRSSKPEAVQFQQWVTSEVLPTIRKSGMYMTKEVATEALEDTDSFIARALVMATDKLAKEVLKSAALQKTNDVLVVRAKGLEENDVADTSVLQFVHQNKLNATRGQRIALGIKAGVLGDLAGRPKIKTPREYVDGLGEVRTGYAVVHTKKALERAAVALGLIKKEEPAHA